MAKIAIIGAGRGGTALVEMLHNDPLAQIVGIADVNQSAPGIHLADKLRIPTYASYEKLLHEKTVDLVIDVTGSKEMGKSLEKFKRRGLEVLGGYSAMFMWQLIQTYQSLYSLGLQLTSSKNLQRLYSTVVEYATRLTDTPAGCLALFDEKKGEMNLVAMKGFSKQPERRLHWRLRKGDLSSHILNQKGPVTFPNIQAYSSIDNPLLRQDGLKSLASTSLSADGKIVGILSVGGFGLKRFAPREVALLSLLSGLAAMAIQKSRVLEATRILAITDGLTGLFNHRHFLAQLDLEISRARRYHRRLSLLMLDIDHFKHYNDTNGHLTGNKALKEIGRIIRETCRDVDVSARFGGEEFAVIMPETNGGQGRFLAERLRKRIMDCPFENRVHQPGRRLTISIGLASFPDHAQDPYELVEKADQALLKAKKKGRNKVCVYVDRAA